MYVIKQIINKKQQKPLIFSWDSNNNRNLGNKIGTIKHSVQLVHVQY